MDRSDIVYLLNHTKTQNEFLAWVDTIAERQAFCEVTSVSQSEYFEGGRNGLNPSFRFRLFRYDYNGETELKYNGITYRIYRTFIDKNDVIDLYAELRQGN